MDLGLAGRVALVCGSTQGLGRAVAKALGHEGARVAINGRHEDSVARAAQQLSSETGQVVLPFAADVGDGAEAAGLVERVHHEMGRLDVLFCNASGPPAAPFTHQPADAFQRALELNLLSAVHLARAAVPIMRKVQWGRIICLASVAAKQPLPGLILSTTARAGVLGFAKALADEVAPEGITVNVVAPGWFDSPLAGGWKNNADLAAGIIGHTAQRRWGAPTDLAGAYQFFASDSSAFVTGTVLSVDGGYLLA